MSGSATATSRPRAYRGPVFEPDGAAPDPALWRSVARGGALTLAAQGAKAVSQFAAIAVLSRLLDPRDYGLVAVAAAVVGLVELFKDFGLSMATVQRPHITHEQVSALFWINALAGLLLALLASAAAPGVARLYGEPRLTGLTVAASASLALGGLGVQHLALLRRGMQFGALALIEVGAHAAGLAVAVALAAAGGGPWALVAQPAVGAAVTAAGAFLASDWRPSWRVWSDGVRPLLSFGADLAGCNVLSFLSKSLDNLLIGWRWGAGPLGLYSRAYAVLFLPVTQLNGPISSVAIPVLSRLRGDPRAFADYYLRFLAALLTLTTPAAFTMWLFAPEVVRVLLGPGWSGAGPVLQALSAASPVLPVWYACGWLFASTGRTRQYLGLWTVLCSGLALAFVLGLPGGVLGVARAYAVAMWVLIGVFVPLALRGTGVSPSRMAWVVGRPAAACACGALALAAVTWPAGDGGAGAFLKVAAGATVLTLSSGLAWAAGGEPRSALAAAFRRRAAASARAESTT